MSTTIRFANPDDASTLWRFIMDLAIYEKEPDAVKVTPERLADQMRQERPPFEALLIEEGEISIGFALFFHTYSTWTGYPGIHLEDLYVMPEKRGQGAGKALLAFIAKLAVERGCKRFEWAFEPMTELTCDGLDNDCDGSADEDFALTTLDGTELSGVGVACGTGACAGGETVCNAEKNGIICSTEAAKTEVCDGIDNDCDGLVDGADFDLVLEPCAKNVGVCEGLIMTTDYCVDGTWKACTDEDYLAYNDTYEPEAETVCDGLDNDCDGAVDDDFLLTQLDGSTVQGIGEPCGLGACIGGVTLCGGDEASIICSTAGESSPEICDGIDNDCKVTYPGC